MKTFILATMLALSPATLSPLSAQAPSANNQEQLSALLKEITAQQATIADNQAKAEEKLATLTETLRQARIYASRGGR